jgi:hypothetical protein
MMYRTLGFLFLVVVVGTLCGCGKGEPTASGKVYFEGQLVPNGMIMFVPIGDQKITADSGKIIDGMFNFPTKPGKKRVEIYASRPGRIDPMMKSAIQVEYIPEKYNSKSTLEKEITVTGNNEFEFKLTK